MNFSSSPQHDLETEIAINLTHLYFGARFRRAMNMSLNLQNMRVISILSACLVVVLATWWTPSHIAEGAHTDSVTLQTQPLTAPHRFTAAAANDDTAFTRKRLVSPPGRGSNPTMEALTRVASTRSASNSSWNLSQTRTEPTRPISFAARG